MITFRPLMNTLKVRGITLKDLAEMCGVSQAAISSIVHYNLKPYSVNIRNVEKICKALGCSIDEVIENDRQYETVGTVLRKKSAEGCYQKNNEFRKLLQDHPWLKGIEPDSIKWIL